MESGPDRRQTRLGTVVVEQAHQKTFLDGVLIGAHAVQAAIQINQLRRQFQMPRAETGIPNDSMSLSTAR